MHCSRCHGLMLKDRFLDMGGRFGEMWVQSWRCVSCGAVHDAVVEQNRLARQEMVLAPTSGKPDFQEDAICLGGEAFIRPMA